MNENLRRLLPQFPQRFGVEFQVDAIEATTGGFSGAEVFRLETSVGSYCLRAWPRDSLPVERIRGLHRLLRHVHDAGVVEVAVPICTHHGDTLFSHGGKSWQVEPWMPGCADFHSHPAPERIRSAFMGLARWHAAASSFQPTQPTSAESHWFRSESSAVSPAVNERLQQLRELKHDWSDARGFDRLSDVGRRLPDRFADLCLRALHAFRRTAASVIESLQAATSIRVDLQPCIRDVWHDHLLFTDDRLTGLIDCNATRTENVASDLARLTGSLFGDDHRSQDAALAAYESMRRITSDERALMRILDRSGVLLSAMHWVRRLLAHDPAINNDVVWSRLNSFVLRMEHGGEPRTGEPYAGEPHV